jgi:integrase
MAGKQDHRGFGHIRKLPSGRWQASYIGPDLARHTAPTTYEDKDTAVVWLRNERVLAESDDWMPPKQRAQQRRRDAFVTYADAWLTHRPLKPRTKAHYRKLLDRAILPALGGLTVRHITPESVRAWHAALDPTTPTQNAHCYALLKAILATAVEDDLLPANPCRIRGAGQARRASKTEPATLDELAIIVEKSPERFRLMVLLAAWCAMRFGELIELRRCDVNVRNGTVHIRRAVAWVAGEPVVGKPKSDAGARDIAIPPHLLPAVRAHLRAMPMTGRDALLFPSAEDPVRQMRQSTLQRAYYPAREAAGRPDLRFHDLRHTGAVLAAATGATLAELMSRLGHSTPGAAMRYQHAAKGRDAEIAAALSALARHAE